MSQNYVLQKTRTLTASNGTKIKFWGDEKKEYVQILCIAKALGYTTFNPKSSLLAMILKNHDFQVHVKNIKNKSSYVIDAERIVPLLKSFVKLALNVSTNNPYLSLRQDDARMEAEQLIELFSQPAFTKSSIRAQTTSDSAITVKETRDIIQTPCEDIKILISKENDLYLKCDAIYRSLGNKGKCNHSTNLIKVAIKTHTLKRARLENYRMTFNVISVTDAIKTVLPQLKSTAHRSPRLNEVRNAFTKLYKEQPETCEFAPINDDYKLAQQNCFWVAKWIGKDPENFFAHCLLEHFLHTASLKEKGHLKSYLEKAMKAVDRSVKNHLPTIEQT